MGMMGTMLPPGSLPGQQVQQPQVQQQPAQQPAPAAASAAVSDLFKDDCMNNVLGPKTKTLKTQQYAHFGVRKRQHLLMGDRMFNVHGMFMNAHSKKATEQGSCSYSP
eukprot:6488388-Amphidinium_carterae.1